MPDKIGKVVVPPVELGDATKEQLLDLQKDLQMEGTDPTARW